MFSQAAKSTDGRPCLCLVKQPSQQTDVLVVPTAISAGGTTPGFPVPPTEGGQKEGEEGEGVCSLHVLAATRNQVIAGGENIAQRRVKLFHTVSHPLSVAPSAEVCRPLPAPSGWPGG